MKTNRLVHNAVHRALDATVASSPRTIIITRQPTSGSHVISDKMGKPAALLIAVMISPAQHEDTDQQDDADQHDEGINGEGTSLDFYHLPRAITSSVPPARWARHR